VQNTNKSIDDAERHEERSHAEHGNESNEINVCHGCVSREGGGLMRSTARLVQPWHASQQSVLNPA